MIICLLVSFRINYLTPEDLIIKTDFLLILNVIKFAEWKTSEG